MAFEESPQFTDITADQSFRDNFPGAVFAEAWTDDPILAAKWQRYGCTAIFPLWQDGLRRDLNGDIVVIPLIDSGTPYTRALAHIKNLISFEKLPPESHDEAIQALMDGDFDESPWAAYLS